MPRILEELPEDTAYPWTSWMDGQIREFQQGEDFDCAPKTFARLARRAGWRQTPRRPVYARVNTKRGTVVLRFLPPEEEQ